MNTILTKIDDMKDKTVAYANDVAVAIKGKYLNIMSQCMGVIFKVLRIWSISCGVYPSNTRKYRVDSFRFLKMTGTDLQIIWTWFRLVVCRVA